MRWVFREARPSTGLRELFPHPPDTYGPGRLACLPLSSEAGVLQGLLGRDSLIRVVGHHCMQEGEALRGQTGCQ